MTTTQDITFTLRALAHLLRYPDAAMRARLPDVHAALRAEGAAGAARRAELDALMDRLLAEGLDAEAAYVDLFDRGRGTALHLFEHVHGDSRDRGPAMVDLVRTYEQAGLLLDPAELPDHLTVLLEYASTQPAREARAFVGEFAHILRSIAAALQRRGSDYAAVLAALLELAGEPAAEGDAGACADDEPLDTSWEEPAAFGGCSTQGQAVPAGPGQPQPVHLVRRTPPAAAR
ncbi:nitrate reductase molybdenum cofactor assembly chaperone [Aquincola sp. MAHUQ-54]|uniref:Nitrate reductase molybdenum cofactor assembly chaperone n=1 Tax=Aquincola agrisoli TaxID=3119538 RepID=A0AAW9QE17_9BURK